MYDDNSFELAPGERVEKERAVPPGQDFEKAMGNGVPEFAGDRYGIASPDNEYYGEAASNEAEGDGEEYDAGIADAAALINYGLNAAAREMGVETVVQKIKGFDASGRTDPIGDLFEYLGINTPEEHKAVCDEAGAAAAGEAAFREGVNKPSERKSVEGAFKALDDMKELISEVEGADPRYEELRAGARAAGKGYFEYAVSGYGVQGLTELFQVLAAQREKATEKDAEVVAENEAEVVAEGGLGSESAVESGFVTETGSMAETKPMTEAGPMTETEPMTEPGSEVEPGTESREELEQRLRKMEQLNPEILRKEDQL